MVGWYPLLIEKGTTNAKRHFFFIILGFLVCGTREDTDVDDLIENISNQFKGLFKNKTKSDILTVVDAVNVSTEGEDFCCRNLLLTSAGRSAYFYPTVHGKYKLRNSTRAFYTSEDGNFFIQKSDESKDVWSVTSKNLSEQAYILSSGAVQTLCPAHVENWLVFDRNLMEWASDITFKMTCVQYHE